MIIATSTTVYSDLTTVTSSLISSVIPFVILMIGLSLTFYLMEVLISVMKPKEKENKTVYDEHGNVKYIEF